MTQPHLRPSASQRAQRSRLSEIVEGIPSSEILQADLGTPPAAPFARPEKSMLRYKIPGLRRPLLPKSV